MCLCAGVSASSMAAAAAESQVRFSGHTLDKATKAKVTLENYYSNLIAQHLERKQRYGEVYIRYPIMYKYEHFQCGCANGGHGSLTDSGGCAPPVDTSSKCILPFQTKLNIEYLNYDVRYI